MDSIKTYILKHPMRIKYGLMIANIFIILIAARMYINYSAIEDAIQDTIIQSQQKTLELAFSENFLLNYEKSEYARYFLQHENNIIGPGEFIIKFEKMPEKTQTGTTEIISQYDQKEYLKTPQQSRNRFILDKMSKVK
jgi:hypothetical protein